MKMFKRVLAAVCTLAVTATMISPISAVSGFANAETLQRENAIAPLADTELTMEGTCGENLTWVLDSEGTLTISGTGEMDNYSYFGNSPWRERTNIKSVLIEDGVTSIGIYAFLECSSLTSVTISDSVTSIGGGAFDGCSSLTSVTIPDSVTRIGIDAFWKCSSLESVTIPDSVTIIESYTFYNCSSLTSVTIGNGVTSIGGSAFEGCSSLTSVTIPDSLTFIGYEAFYGCSSLPSVAIPDSVTSINSRAFYGCISLKNVYYSSTEEEWRKISISFGNGNLTNATIHYNSTNSDGTGETSSSDHYNSSNSDDAGEASSSEKCGENLTWVLDDKGTLTISGTGEMYDDWGKQVFDPSTMKFNIARPSWDSKKDDIKAVVIETGVTSICDQAFGGCLNLTSVTIPGSVTSIGWSAFAGCTSLTTVTIPDSVTSIPSSAFQDCTSLTTVTIPDSVTRIEDNTFRDCSSLTSITIPESVKFIGWYAFRGCTIPTTVTIPDSVTSIGEGAFSDCENLVKIDVDTNNANYCSVDGVLFNKKKTELCQYPIAKAATSYVIPKSVTRIVERAFRGCTYLSSVTIPESVTSIGSQAFARMKKLIEINVDANNKRFSSVNGALFSEYQDFTSLVQYPIARAATSYVIPEGVTGICEGAFDGCQNLTSVTIPKGSTIIYVDSFSGCSSLTSITIPDSVTDIANAFDGCTSLKDVYYSGSETQWKEIDISSIDSNNVNLTSATIHYNSTGPDNNEIENRDLHVIGFTFYEVPMEIKWGGGLFEHSSSVYDNDLAIAACALSGLAENKESDLPTKDLLSRMGFSESSMQSDKFNEWNPFMPAYVFAYKDVKVNGKTKKLISVTIRGSQTIFADWLCTDFVDGPSSGFTLSTEFVYLALSNYLIEKGLGSIPKEDMIFFVNGHSLGAAVAAKLTTEIISRGLALQDNTYTYTIAAPRYSNSTKQNKYTNIFELINKYDKVPNLGYPGNPTGTSHYGVWEEFDPNQVTDFYKYWNLWEDGTLEHKEIGRNHGTPAYMSYLLTKEFYTNATVTKRRNNSYLISVRCPVDVEIYDIDDNLLGKVINNAVDDSVMDEAVACKIEGDEKYIFVESDKEIYVKLVGTDSGTMEYSVQKLKAVDEVATDKDFVTYKAVTLEKGKEFYSGISDKFGTANVGLYVVDPKTNLPVKTVELDGAETDVKSGSSLIIILSVSLGVVVLLLAVGAVVVISRRKRR